MSMIVPEIDEIVKFYENETIEQIARETEFTQRDSKFGGFGDNDSRLICRARCKSGSYVWNG